MFHDVFTGARCEKQTYKSDGEDEKGAGDVEGLVSVIGLLFERRFFMLSLLYRFLRTCCNGFRAFRPLGSIREKGVCSTPFRFRCARPARSQGGFCPLWLLGLWPVAS